MTEARRLSPSASPTADEVWAWCAVCDRWFYPRQSEPEGFNCPVCASPAAETAEKPPT